MNILPYPVYAGYNTVNNSHQEREREQYQTLISAAEDGFERERADFERERKHLVEMYEMALQTQKMAHDDTLKQLDKMHELLSTKISQDGGARGGARRTLEMEREEKPRVARARG